MVNRLDFTIKKNMHNLCREHGFVSRGQVFFRLRGDAVLQAISFRYEHTFSHYALNIGLMSLFSEMDDVLLSSQSTLPRYSICCLDNCPTAVSVVRNNGLVSFKVRSPEEQLLLLSKYGFEWLDGVATQLELLNAIDYLDRVSYKSKIWNNRLKLAPFLAVGDYNSADRVIASILDQQLGPQSFSTPPWTEEDFLYYSTIFPNKNTELLCIHELIANKKDNAIKAYLDKEYHLNTDRLHFLEQ